MIEVETIDGKFVQLGVYTIRWVWPRGDGGSDVCFVDGQVVGVREDPGTVRMRVNKAIAGAR